ncbi:hypothetical protein EKN06_14690 [Croceicoccus ponticola]|uniref:Poly(3-hydroxyalkanoate) polymerase subunit PhaE n=1 Tax=Croceicoccus ponticola TaxID=2217664 RepID=A0A437GU50_9SPHN|nr:poly(R)-hydroxyalkanoic acid synthase subunit PhaE [Croceicoccus ponticola]RVQ64842.1 hypothetical protein EKN06_14690 [Croceicoccus ponticola]
MTDKQFNPIEAWQEIVQRWETELNEWSSQITQSEEFGALIGQATKATVYAQKTMAEQTEAVLRSLNLPSKSQIDEISERLAVIEDHLAQLKLAVGERNPAPSAPEPRRTRKPAARTSGNE